MERADAVNRIAVWNKIDLVPERALPELPCPAVRISARTGAGLDELREAFAVMVAKSPRPAVPEVAVNARAARLLAEALELLPEATGAFPRGGVRARRHRHPHGDEPGRRDHRQDRRAGHSRQYFQPLLHREIIFSWKRNRAISGRSF